MKACLFIAATFLFSTALANDPTLNQLPRAMHTAMKERPRVKVGAREGDMVGSDNRVLQAAVDYVGGLGGGVVEDWLRNLKKNIYYKNYKKSKKIMIHIILCILIKIL